MTSISTTNNKEKTMDSHDNIMNRAKAKYELNNPKLKGGTTEKQPLVLKENGFFTSMDSLEEVLDYMANYGGDENAHLCAMTQAFTLNAIIKKMDEKCDGTAICERGTL